MTDLAPNPHVKDGISYGHLLASYTEGTADTSLDLDPYPDERFLTGTVTVRPRFSGQQATAVLRVPGTPRARGLVITEQEYKIVNSRLVDRQDREGVWLMIAVGDIPIHWQATVVLRDANNRAVHQTAYALTDASWTIELDGTRISNLPDLIPNPGLITPSELAAIQSAQSAMDRSMQVAAELEEVRPDIVAAGARAAAAIEAAGTAEREADRAVGLADAQDEVVAEHVVTDGRQTRSAVDERILAVGNATYEPKISVSANAYGASPEATWQVNRDAFQAANDAVAAAGGGRVTAEPNTYLAKGIVQDSRVEFHTPGVVLEHPGGAGHVIEARFTTQRASTTGQSRTLTVEDTSKFEVGQRIAIERAGGILDTQNTRLNAAIDATQTTGITLANPTKGWPSVGTMQINSELITYTGISAGTLTGVTRGAFGTAAAPHGTIELIGVARVHYANVLSIDSGTQLTMTVMAAQSVVNSPVRISAVEPGLSMVTIFGTHEGGTSYGVNWPTVTGGKVQTLNVIGAAAGVMLDQGADRCRLDDIRLHDCYNTAIGGAALWMFRGCTRNRVTNFEVTGVMWVGAYIDDRTTTATPWDAPNDRNRIIGFDIDALPPAGTTGWPPAFSIIGSTGNKIATGTIRFPGPTVGLQIDFGSQVTTAEPYAVPTSGNEFSSVFMVDVAMPWNISTPGNILHDVDYIGASGNPVTASGNLTYAAKKATNGVVELGVEFLDGQPGRPGIRFAEDPDTGILRWGSGGFAFSHNGVRGLTWLPDYVAFPDAGYKFNFGSGAGATFGTTASQKQGWWGVPPKVQPEAVANATDAASTTARLNDLLARLRSIGLIAS